MANSPHETTIEIKLTTANLKMTHIAYNEIALYLIEAKESGLLEDFDIVEQEGPYWQS